VTRTTRRAIELSEDYEHTASEPEYVALDAESEEKLIRRMRQASNQNTNFEAITTVAELLKQEAQDREIVRLKGEIKRVEDEQAKAVEDLVNESTRPGGLAKILRLYWRGIKH
jgi:uncharacterized protein HemY